jgi:hypothetical protein
VGHLSDGALRRMIDEPLAASEADRRHLESCTGCGERSERLANEARLASALLAVPGFEPDSATALARVNNLAAVAPAPRRAWARLRWSMPRASRPLALVGALAVLGLISISATPSILTIFQVTPNSGVTTVPITQPAEGAVAGLPDLSQYGTTKVLEQGTTQTVLTAAEATQLTGLTPPAAPADYAGKTVTYTVIGESKVSFTFDKAKATAAAAAAGKPAPVFPAGIDGTTVTVTVGPAVGELFGTISKSTDLSNLPLIAGAAKPPVVVSNGVSANELESFLVQQPGIAGNATLVAEIKAIGDPLASGNLVIPIPANLATSKPETVNGSSGVLIADNTGMAKGLVWEQNGIVYAVGGHFDEQQLLGIANGIK